MGNELKNIKFKYVFDDQYTPTYISGGIGGITPGKDIVINFYFERHPIPYKETTKIKNDGSMEVISREPETESDQLSFIRHIENGIVMNLNTAKSIREYLDKQIKILEEESK